ncbi:hypothetical protein ACFQ3L_01745 [Lacticaseibacillus jixianensis]|uniref:Phosphatidate cytidylyltransferase n=1 Tax=Lacticaseibacillus jixianensis TaxID=2486012 RepID=A0ABW4B818_9LACO|nr:hypothetical protein [Lacticaseibacillus jixianensis]
MKTVETFFHKYSGLTALALVLIAVLVPSAANLVFAFLIIFLGITAGYWWFQKNILNSSIYALAMIVLLFYISKR